MKLSFIRDLMMCGISYDDALMRWERIELESAIFEQEYKYRKREAQENSLWGIEIGSAGAD